MTKLPQQQLTKEEWLDTKILLNIRRLRTYYANQGYVPFERMASTTVCKHWNFYLLDDTTGLLKPVDVTEEDLSGSSDLPDMYARQPVLDILVVEKYLEQYGWPVYRNSFYKNEPYQIITQDWTGQPVTVVVVSKEMLYARVTRYADIMIRVHSRTRFKWMPRTPLGDTFCDYHKQRKDGRIEIWDKYVDDSGHTRHKRYVKGYAIGGPEYWARLALKRRPVPDIFEWEPRLGVNEDFHTPRHPLNKKTADPYREIKSPPRGGHYDTTGPEADERYYERKRKQKLKEDTDLGHKVADDQKEDYMPS